jgi:hypothetical protein
VHVLREDPTNPDLLYAGTELGLFASWDGAETWSELDLANLPTVAVHDLLVHPEENDLIVGTHGRGIWILDDATPIQRWRPDLTRTPVHLFPVRPGMRFPLRFTRYGLGDQEHTAPNPPYGALIHYALAEKIGKGPAETADAGEEGPDGEDTAEDRIRLEIVDASGAVIRTIEQKDLPAEKGVNRVAWDLTWDPPKPRKEGEGAPGSEFFGPVLGPSALPGVYTARLTVDGRTVETPVEVTVDPLVEVTGAELRAAFETASDLTAMKESVNEALRALDVVVEDSAALRSQLQRLERFEDDLPEDLRETWAERETEAKELVKLLAGEEGRPFWSQGPALGDRITRLAMSVDAAFRAPTAAQEEYHRELRDELGQALETVNLYLGEALPALNERLEAAGAPALFEPRAVEVPVKKK